MEFDNLYDNIQHWLQVDLGKAGQEMTAKIEALPVQSSVKMASQFSIMCNHFRHNGTDARQWHPPGHLIRHSLYWLRTLQQGTKFEVTDQRDRVYALLGVLSSPTTRLYVAAPDFGISASKEKVADVFPVDYEKTVSQVYQDFMKYLINTNKNLDCLCVFQDRWRQAADLPSWVLDWRRGTHRILVDFPPDPPDIREVLALATTQNLNNDGVLSISGFWLDQIYMMHGKNDVSELIRQPRRFWSSRGLGGPSNSKDEAFRRMKDLANLSYVQANRYLYTISSQNSNMAKDIEHFRIYVPRESMLDDNIVCAKGAEHPLILRHVSGDQYQFIGPAVLVAFAESDEPDGLDASRLFMQHVLGIQSQYKGGDDIRHHSAWDLPGREMRTYLLV